MKSHEHRIEAENRSQNLDQGVDVISDEWYLTDRKGKGHRFVCMELAKWMGRVYPGASVCCGLKSVAYRNTWYEHYYLSPDLDVAVVRDSKLIGCEVKLLSGRAAGKTERWKSKWKPQHRLGLPAEDRVIRAADKEIYKGLGQALFLPKYVHQAYLAIPDLDYLGAMQGGHEFDGEGANVLASLRGTIVALMNYLPIGLLMFSPKGRQQDELQFRVMHEAKNFDNLFGGNSDTDYVIQAVKERGLRFPVNDVALKGKGEIQVGIQAVKKEEVHQKIETIQRLIEEKEHQLQLKSDLEIRVWERIPAKDDLPLFLGDKIPAKYIAIAVAPSFVAAFVATTGQRFDEWAWMKMSTLFRARRLK